MLKDIGAIGKPEILAYNKCDKGDYPETAEADKNRHIVYISAKKKEGLCKLIDAISELAPGKKQKITVIIPYSEGSLASELHTTQKVLEEEYTETGTKLTLLADSVTFGKLRNYIEQQ